MFINIDAAILLQLLVIIHKNKGDQLSSADCDLNLTGENICHWRRTLKLPACLSETHKRIRESQSTAFICTLTINRRLTTQRVWFVNWVKRGRRGGVIVPFCETTVLFWNSKGPRRTRPFNSRKTYETFYLLDADAFRCLSLFCGSFLFFPPLLGDDHRDKHTCRFEIVEVSLKVIPLCTTWIINCASLLTFIRQVTTTPGNSDCKSDISFRNYSLVYWIIV